MVVAVIIIIILLLPVVYSYLLYPIILLILPKKEEIYDEYVLEERQKIAIIIPVHNEEKILAQKIESIIESSFPKEKLELFLLFDACTDNSISIAQKFKNQGITLNIILFENRMGKPQLLNTMMKKLDPNIYPITIFSDANVLFFKNTIEKLLEPFSQKMVGLVDSHIVPASDFNTHEYAYLQYEYIIKFLESIKLGYMQGPFGGCYAIRTSTFSPVPDNFLVDDFYIGTNVILQGYYSIVAKDALVIEHYMSDWDSEFRRKRRISGGNLQNLFYMFPHYLKKKKFIALFCFISHKVLRWLSPFFAFLAAIIILFLFFNVHFAIQIFLITIVLASIDILFSYLLKRTPFTRHILYFVWMNVATVLGYLDYFKGIGSNIWQRTER